MISSEPIGTCIVFGASCRSAAASAKSAGFEVLALDRFSDRDLQAIVGKDRARELDDFESVLLSRRMGRLRESRETSSWLLLTGGAEHAWERLQTAPGFDELLPLGPSPKDFEPLRDLCKWSEWSFLSGTQMPDTILSPCHPCSRHGACRLHRASSHASVVDRYSHWLWKPLRSGGGQGIRENDTDAFPYWPLADKGCDGYWQSKIEGKSLGVVHLADRHRCQLLGACQAWDTDSELAHALHLPGRYVYGGGFGPISLPTRIAHALEAFGSLIHREFPWIGWLQSDWILDDDGALWLLEINPRWSANMELFEGWGGCNLVGLSVDMHLGRDWEIPGAFQQLCAGNAPGSPEILGKAVLYAERDRIVSQEESDRLWSRSLVRALLSDAMPRRASGCSRLESEAYWYADIPNPNTVIHAGEPMFSVLAGARSAASLHERIGEGIRGWV